MRKMQQQTMQLTCGTTASQPCWSACGSCSRQRLRAWWQARRKWPVQQTARLHRSGVLPALPIFQVLGMGWWLQAGGVTWAAARSRLGCPLQCTRHGQ